MKPIQIVGGFTYGGTVLYEAQGGRPAAHSDDQAEMPGEVRRTAPGSAQRRTDQATWPRLRALVRAEVLCAPRPWLSAPSSASADLCDVCHGPAGPRRALCFQCDLHRQCAAGLVADLVVPVAFAIKAGQHAGNLWQYKSAALPPRAREAHSRLLRALLLLFLRDHGRCLWAAAGIRGPTHVAVVPTGRGRPEPHPLRTLVAGYIDSPWADLTARPGCSGDRDLDPARYAAAVPPGARVLLLDDTWTTGSSAQSAAMALRLAGARSVVTVVLGRHVSGPIAEAAGLSPAAMPYRPELCAVHRGARS